jgi:hypothetical protein
MDAKSVKVARMAGIEGRLVDIRQLAGLNIG